MMDALRLVAVFGAVLWLMPVIWPSGGNPEVDPVRMSSALSYVFGVWLLLILLAGVLAGLLRDRDAVQAEAKPSEDEDE